VATPCGLRLSTTGNPRSSAFFGDPALAGAPEDRWALAPSRSSKREAGTVNPRPRSSPSSAATRTAPVSGDRRLRGGGPRLPVACADRFCELPYAGARVTRRTARTGIGRCMAAALARREKNAALARFVGEIGGRSVSGKATEPTTIRRIAFDAGGPPPTPARSRPSVRFSRRRSSYLRGRYSAAVLRRNEREVHGVLRRRARADSGLLMIGNRRREPRPFVRARPGPCSPRRSRPVSNGEWPSRSVPAHHLRPADPARFSGVSGDGAVPRFGLSTAPDDVDRLSPGARHVQTVFGQT